MQKKKKGVGCSLVGVLGNGNELLIFKQWRMGRLNHTKHIERKRNVKRKMFCQICQILQDRNCAKLFGALLTPIRIGQTYFSNIGYYLSHWLYSLIVFLFFKKAFIY
jgi:hypothetical protein